MLVYNSYATPNLDHLSPFKVAIGRKAVLTPKFEYKEKLDEKLKYFKKRLEAF